MTGYELLEITGGILVNPTSKVKEVLREPFGKIEIDSRQIKKGDLFIALKGPQNDGHHYLEEVIKKKVKLILLEEEGMIESTKVPMIKVTSTYDALFEIAAYYRKKYPIPLIAVTGSVGKTTTKELIASILSTQYQVLKNEGNFNNHIGVPLTLFGLKEKHNLIVCEMGMNHFGEIAKLSRLCQPDIGVITNIGTSHIGNLGSKKNIWKAKMEITEGMKDGILVLNGDDSYLKKVHSTEQYQVCFCGVNRNTYLPVRHIDASIDGTQFEVKISDQWHKFFFPVPSLSLLPNVLLAIQIGILFDIPAEDIKKSIENYQPTKGRMQIDAWENHITSIDDCYNASYESFASVLSCLKKDKRDKICILGSMLELGKFSKKYHHKLGKELKKIDHLTVYAIGEEMRPVKKVLKKRCHFFSNQEDLLEALKKVPLKDCIILWKGSRRMKLEEVKSQLKAYL